jgi:hypothetical protein
MSVVITYYNTRISPRLIRHKAQPFPAPGPAAQTGRVTTGAVLRRFCGFWEASHRVKPNERSVHDEGSGNLGWAHFLGRLAPNW